MFIYVKKQIKSSQRLLDDKFYCMFCPTTSPKFKDIKLYAIYKNIKATNKINFNIYLYLYSK